jgi:hypothetical protein
MEIIYLLYLFLNDFSSPYSKNAAWCSGALKFGICLNPNDDRYRKYQITNLGVEVLALVDN